MMFKSTVIYLISTLWIGSWGLFAVDEVSATFSHLMEKHGGQLSSVLKPGYVMHEKNGVKFMIKQETAEALGVVTLEMECNSPEFWDNIEYEVDLETLEFVVDFNSLRLQRIIRFKTSMLLQSHTLRTQQIGTFEYKRF